MSTKFPQPFVLPTENTALTLTSDKLELQQDSIDINTSTHSQSQQNLNLCAQIWAETCTEACPGFKPCCYPSLPACLPVLRCPHPRLPLESY